jgi:hypothetical protein
MRGGRSLLLRSLHGLRRASSSLKISIQKNRGTDYKCGEDNRTIHRPNENKMSDGGRHRASLGVKVWTSSQKWNVQRSAVRSIAWLDLKLDRSKDGIITMTVGYLFLKVDYDPPLHAPLALHGFRPGDDGLLLIRVEYVSNDDVRLIVVVSRPCGID